MQDDLALARGLLGSASVGTGPTDEQHRIIDCLIHGYFGLDASADALEPLDPAGLAAAVPPEDRSRALDLLIVVELCRHPSDPAQAARTEAYAAALGAEGGWLEAAHDVLIGSIDRVMADYGRLAETPAYEPALESIIGTDREAEAAVEVFARMCACAPGTLGAEVVAFYERWGFPIPGTGDGPAGISLLTHDMGHVIAGYDTSPPDEIALQAMLLAASGFEQHFSSLMAALLLSEAGALPFPGIEPVVGALGRAGAPEELADAFTRGAACSGDFGLGDHLALIDEPLDAVRARYGIPPRAV
ncbi:MAG: hypothetical protein RLZZ467_47 [Gemmatimonadota bacterium]|jgi:hypothetical protein